MPPVANVWPAGQLTFVRKCSSCGEGHKDISIYFSEGEVFFECPNYTKESGRNKKVYVVFSNKNELDWEDEILGVNNVFSWLFDRMNGVKKHSGLDETPSRWLNMMQEMTSGYIYDPKQYLEKQFDNDGNYDELILSKNIPFSSLCEHHLLPFTGVAHVAYIPQEGGKIVGLSKLARVVEGYAKRLQVQERLTAQIHGAINETLNPLGVCVIIKASHSCQALRGVKKSGEMVTSKMSGVFREDSNNARMELMELIKL